jgi:hypothetical protein
MFDLQPCSLTVSQISRKIDLNSQKINLQINYHVCLPQLAILDRINACGGEDPVMSVTTIVALEGLGQVM